MILHIDGVDQEAVRCCTCGALVLDVDLGLHESWHDDMRAQFRAAFDAIYAVDAKGGY